MGRDLELARAWRGRIRRFERSGLTIREFCAREDLVVHQFSWWRRELKRRRGESGKRRGTFPPTGSAKRDLQRGSAAVGKFVPVQVTPPAATKAPLEIVLGQPLRIAVSSGFDPHLLVDVIRTLEGLPC
jgi:transposase-like protein